MWPNFLSVLFPDKTREQYLSANFLVQYVTLHLLLLVVLLAGVPLMNSQSVWHYANSPSFSFDTFNRGYLPYFQNCLQSQNSYQSLQLKAVPFLVSTLLASYHFITRPTYLSLMRCLLHLCKGIRLSSVRNLVSTT